MTKVCIIANERQFHGTAIVQIAPNCFRLDEELGLFLAAKDHEDRSTFPRLGDSIETVAKSDGSFEYVRVTSRGPFRHYERMLSPQLLFSPSLYEFLANLRSVGGHWLLFMSGFLVTSVPKNSSFDFEEQLSRAASDA